MQEIWSMFPILAPLQKPELFIQSYTPLAAYGIIFSFCSLETFGIATKYSSDAGITSTNLGTSSSSSFLASPSIYSSSSVFNSSAAATHSSRSASLAAFATRPSTSARFSSLILCTKRIISSGAAPIELGDFSKFCLSVTRTLKSTPPNISTST